MQTAGKDLKTLQSKLDEGTPSIGFSLPEVKLSAEIDIQTIKQNGRNVLARFPAEDGKTSEQQVLLGAHVDHLGRGGSSSSLARDEEENLIHFGADDNASGIAAMLEIAGVSAETRKKAGRYSEKRDVVFAAWSGEEVGLFGLVPIMQKQLAMSSSEHAHHGEASRRRAWQFCRSRQAHSQRDTQHRPMQRLNQRIRTSPDTMSQASTQSKPAQGARRDRED